MLTTSRATPMERYGVAIATVIMLVLSGGILYPAVTPENILVALRVSATTTAIPFFLFFIAQPLRSIARGQGQWLQRNRRFLWLILTISHLIHLYQIWLYYQLGNRCPWSIWLVTSPLWMIMVILAVLELAQPQTIDAINQAPFWRPASLCYRLGIGYIWLIFTLTFGLNIVEQHLLFYNGPGLILYLAGPILFGIVGWRQRYLNRYS